MNPTSPETRLRQLAETLAAPDIHIPAAVPAGIDPAALKRAVRLFRSAVFAGYFDAEPVAASLGELSDILARQSARACATFHRGVHPDAGPFGREVAAQLLEQLPELRRRLGTDVKAVFDGDPAAVSYEEVILCYPALVALTHYRLAHALLRLGVPILPRLISEAAHSATGIDIHPGAEIGEYFSIDHGTGVVIGETCVIGNHVRLYQGVTLGAKSFKFDAAGNILQEPRHPILEDNVVVYSNSSILGRVRIGHDTVIGGNVWQTTDLPPYSRVIQGRPSVSTFENGGGI